MAEKHNKMRCKAKATVIERNENAISHKFLQNKSHRRVKV
jgi:hypothetical protein